MLPCFTSPWLGCNSPRIIFNNVDLPAPLGPRSPTLSPRNIVPVKSLTICLSPKASDTFSSAATIFPVFCPELISNFTCPTSSLRCDLCSRKCSKRAIRLTLRVLLASTP